MNDVPYDVIVKVGGRSIIKTNVGSFSTIVTELHFPHDSALEGYKVKAYFSDDERHVPVFASAKLPAGEIRVELAGSELPGGTPPSIDSTTPPVASAQSNVQPAPSSASANLEGIPGIPGISATPNNVKPVNPTTATPVPSVGPNSAGADKVNTNKNAPRSTTPSESANHVASGTSICCRRTAQFQHFS